MATKATKKTVKPKTETESPELVNARRENNRLQAALDQANTQLSDAYAPMEALKFATEKSIENAEKTRAALKALIDGVTRYRTVQRKIEAQDYVVSDLTEQRDAFNALGVLADEAAKFLP